MAAAVNQNNELEQLLADYLEEGIIDEEEWLIINEVLDEEQPRQQQRRNINIPHLNYPAFNFDSWSEDECWVDLRFHKAEIPRLARALHLPEEILTYNRVKVTSTEALCILLRRLAFPCRYSDLVAKFGRPRAQICIIFNHVLSLVYEDSHHLLSSFDQAWLSRDCLKYFADKIRAKGAPLNNGWCFIDGMTYSQTFRRPKNYVQWTQKGPWVQISIHNNT